MPLASGRLLRSLSPGARVGDRLPGSSQPTMTNPASARLVHVVMQDAAEREAQPLIVPFCKNMRRCQTQKMIFEGVFYKFPDETCSCGAPCSRQSGRVGQGRRVAMESASGGRPPPLQKCGWLSTDDDLTASSDAAPSAQHAGPQPGNAFQADSLRQRLATPRRLSTRALRAGGRIKAFPTAPSVSAEEKGDREATYDGGRGGDVAGPRSSRAWMYDRGDNLAAFSSLRSQEQRQREAEERLHRAARLVQAVYSRLLGQRGARREAAAARRRREHAAIVIQSLIRARRIRHVLGYRGERLCGKPHG